MRHPRVGRFSNRRSSSAYLPRYCANALRFRYVWLGIYILLLSDAEAGVALGDGVGILVDGSASSLADGSDDLVESRVERGILSGGGLELHGDRVGTRGLGEDGGGVSKGLAVLSRGVDLDEDLSSSGDVGDAVVHHDGEGGSLGTRVGVDGQGGDGSLGVLGSGADVQSHADSDGIGVQLVDDVGELEVRGEEGSVRSITSAGEKTTREWGRTERSRGALDVQR